MVKTNLNIYFQLHWIVKSNFIHIIQNKTTLNLSECVLFLNNVTNIFFINIDNFHHY